MRLLKLGIYYDTYLKDFYKARPELKTQSYGIQHRTLINDCFGSSDFWTNALNKLDYETADIIANAESLQKAWARENDSSFVKSKWLFEIAAAQIKKFRPDVVLVADYSTFTADFLKKIKSECPCVRLILGWCSAPYEDSSVFREWDIALSCVPEMVADFRAAGLQSFHVNHAFAPRILDQLDPKSHPKIDFAFIGSVLKQNKFHVERERLLIQLVEHTNLQIFSDINFPSFRQREKARIRRRLSDIFARAPERFLNKLPLPQKITGLKTPAIADQTIDKRIARRTHPPVFGLEMFQQIKDSCVVFNNHIDISPVSASNMRLFETTGAGACLITDWKENLPQLFEPDTEVLTYKSAAECVEKVRYILENEGERRKIAEAGQRRTLREHTFENRAARIDEIIRGAISASR